MHNLRRTVLLSLAFAALVYLGLTIWSDFSDLVTAFRAVNTWYFVPIILLTCGNYALRFSKWQYYLTTIGETIPRRDSLAIFLSGFALSITPGKLGEVIRSFFLKERFHIPVTKSAPIVIADRLADMLALVIMAAAGAISFQYGGVALVATSIVLLGIVILVAWRSLAIRVIDQLTRVGPLRKRGESLRTLYESSHQLLALPRLVPMIILSVAAWGLEALGFYITGQALGVSIPLTSAFFIYAFSTIIGAISFLPGGLGLTEGTLTGLLLLLNISKAAAAAATLIIRVATLWFAVIIGVIALIFVQRRYKL